MNNIALGVMFVSSTAVFVLGLWTIMGAPWEKQETTIEATPVAETTTVIALGKEKHLAKCVYFIELIGVAHPLVQARILEEILELGCLDIDGKRGGSGGP